jgi:cytochrome c biogenesis protein CcdA
MLLAPQSWYNDLPAGVPDTGPYNGHFIRDLGLVFVLIGASFIWAASRLHQSRPIILVITAFFTGHALLHVWDLTSSRLPHSHWKMDAPAVFLPAILLILLNFIPQRYLKQD